MPTFRPVDEPGTSRYMADKRRPGGDDDIRHEQEEEVLDREAFEEDLMSAEESELGEQVDHVD